MAELGKAIYSRLTNDSDVAALVSTRVYPLILPQNPTLPAVTYQTVAGTRETAMGSNPGVAAPVVQFDTWARTYKESRDLALKVKAAIERWRGTEQGVEILDAFIQREEDMYESDTDMWRSSWDYLIWHRE